MKRVSCTSIWRKPLWFSQKSFQLCKFSFIPLVIMIHKKFSWIYREEIPEAILFPNFCIECCRHNLLDAKINSVLSSCHDQAILNAVQTIIQNMIASEDTSQQHHLQHYLQSCGFRGLWRFAGPYTNVSLGI